MFMHLGSQGMWNKQQVFGLGQTLLSEGQPKTASGNFLFSSTLEIQVTPCVFFQHMIFSRSTLTSVQFLGSFRFYLHFCSHPPTEASTLVDLSFHL